MLDGKGLLNKKTTEVGFLVKNYDGNRSKEALMGVLVMWQRSWRGTQGLDRNQALKMRTRVNDIDKCGKPNKEQNDKKNSKRNTNLDLNVQVVLLRTTRSPPTSQPRSPVVTTDLIGVRTTYKTTLTIRTN